MGDLLSRAAGEPEVAAHFRFRPDERQPPCGDWILSSA